MSVNKKLLRIILSGFIALSSIVVLIVRFFVGLNFYTGEINPFEWDYMKYFTSLSNFFNGFVFLYIFIVSLKHYHDDDFKFTKKQKLWVLSATSSVSITFLITIFVLNFTVPNPVVLYQYEILFFHIINPLVTIVIFLFLIPGERITLKESIIGVIPLAIYSFFYTNLVPFRIWDDFYYFTFGGHYWVAVFVFPSVLGIGFLINWLLSFLDRKINKI